jgi:hypothetical protein
MLSDHWLEDTFASLLQCGESARLVLLH